jgi:hypothetical protein
MSDFKSYFRCFDDDFEANIGGVINLIGVSARNKKAAIFSAKVAYTMCEISSVFIFNFPIRGVNKALNASFSLVENAFDFIERKLAIGIYAIFNISLPENLKNTLNLIAPSSITSYAKNICSTCLMLPLFIIGNSTIPLIGMHLAITPIKIYDSILNNIASFNGDNPAAPSSAAR